MKEEIKQQRFTVIIKEVEKIIKNEEGVEETVVEQKEYVIETPPQIETPKDEKLAQLEGRLELYQRELANCQKMVDDIQAEIAELNVPNKVK